MVFSWCILRWLEPQLLSKSVCLNHVILSNMRICNWGKVDMRVGWEVCGDFTWFLNGYLHLFIYWKMSFPLLMRSFCLFTSTVCLVCFFGCTCSRQKFLGQGLKLSHSRSPSLSSDNTGCLTSCTTRELHHFYSFCNEAGVEIPHASWGDKLKCHLARPFHCVVYTQFCSGNPVVQSFCCSSCFKIIPFA